MIRLSLAASIATLGLSAATAACSSAPDSTDVSDENVATSAAALSTGVGSTGLGGIESSDPTAAAAALVASNDGKECRTRTLDPNDPNVVHVVLNDCTGLMGRHHVSGSLTITFSANADGSLHLELASDSLTLDGLAATHQGSADVTFDGNSRHAVWHSVWTHTRRNGELATHNGDHTIDFDSSTGCRTVNGTGVTHVGNRQIDSTITNLVTCEGTNDVDSCPTGTIEHDNLAKQRKAVETFDGTDVATIDISRPKGDRTRTVTLNCGKDSQVESNVTAASGD
jgi:hypothetical protein